jgi:hypothetical protein
LYITIPLADVKDHNIKLTSDKLSFTGSSNGKSYAVDLDFVSMNISSYTVDLDSLASTTIVDIYTSVSRKLFLTYSNSFS